MFQTKFSVGAVLFVFGLCSVAMANDSSDEGIVFFEKHIRPLLSRHCYQCHSQRAKKLEGELGLDSIEGWTRGGSMGASLIPGDSDASLIVRAIRYMDPDLRMPPTKPLPAADIARVEQWIRMGAPAPLGNHTSPPSDANPRHASEHWAYQPLSESSVQDVRAGDWPRSVIDRFVLKKLEANDLTPGNDATPSELVRRLYLQLTGLPPTPEDVKAFEADASPDRVDRLVDRLMTTSRFGQRWGRHWLDLARYADSNGLDENFLFREAWRYRNWVIGAINQDMTLDHFMLEQIAGDLLPYDSIDQRDRQRIAAGFLVIGPKVLLGNNEKNQRMEVADELIDTVGRVVLGQTLGCARCHDHKFDPVPTADYYALAGIFASTNVMEQRFMLGQQRVMERLVGLGDNGNDEDEAYEEYYRELSNLRERKKKADSVLALLRQARDEVLTADEIEKHHAGLDPSAADAALPLEQRIVGQRLLVEDIAKRLANPPKIPPRAMIPADVNQPTDEHIRLAGQFDSLGEKVPRGFLTVLRSRKPWELPANQSGRVALSQWLFDGDNPSGQLAARVLSNRLWHYMMGRGLVRTVDNFGTTGEEPSHPELLDYLARRLIESGWSLKTLVREIAVSRTFALSSQYDSTNHSVDPDNRLWWRANRRRMDPESFRDAMLSAAGELDMTPLDSTVSYLGDQATAVGENKVRRRTDYNCRSVYLPVIRNDLPELFEVFDFANPHVATGARPNTTAPNQALFVLNDEMVMKAAESTAGRIIAELPGTDPSPRLQRMYQLIIGKEATADVLQVMQSFLRTTQENLVISESENRELRALTILGHGLFASSRFQYLD
ncbi:MAG: PSD1 and planctomycete cytochrome C domain-containing protein [Saprospiraceae bacterium]